MRISRRIIAVISITVALLLVSAGVYVWLSAVRGALCLVPVGIEPKDEYYVDAGTFADDIKTARSKALASLIRSFDTATGFFTYEAHPSGMVYDRNNDIRQLLGSSVLAGEAAADESIRPLHEANLSAIMREWYREEGDAGYVFVEEKSKLGANAMLLRVLVASPFYARYSKEAARLRESIIALQKDDGSFKAWYKEPSYAYDEEYLLTFYSGEAILALMEFGEKAGDVRALNAAYKAQDHYIGAYVERIDENYYPAYVPWHTLSLEKLYARTKDDRYKDAAFILNDRLLTMQDRADFIGRFYDPRTPEYGTPHVSSDAVYTEGLAAAYGMAKATADREREAYYRDALIKAFHNLKSLQFEASRLRVFDDRETALKLSGGMRNNACEHRIRIDSTAHAIDAFDAILSALSNEQAPY